MIFATDLHDPEGPLLERSGTWLVTEMAPAYGCVTRLSADGRRLGTVVKTGRPNGLAFDADGALWIAESLTPSIIRLGTDGVAVTVATHCGGRPLAWPNDLCFAADGMLYFTDSGVLISIFTEDGGIGSSDLDQRRAAVEERVNGCLYRLDPVSQELVCLDEGLRFPNGIALGLDGRLYVAETLTGDILRYDINPDSADAGRAVHANVLLEPPGSQWAGPDGMAFDEEGRLYVGVLGQGDVTVLDDEGSILQRHTTVGSLPTNVAFGPVGSRRIYVTEDVTGCLETFEALADGALYPPEAGHPE